VWHNELKHLIFWNGGSISPLILVYLARKNEIIKRIQVSPMKIRVGKTNGNGRMGDPCFVIALARRKESLPGHL
jgi:hypothetical protein